MNLDNLVFASFDFKVKYIVDVDFGVNVAVA